LKVAYKDLWNALRDTYNIEMSAVAQGRLLAGILDA